MTEGEVVTDAETSLPVAWLGRTSTDDQQDPTLSLPRQLRNSREALPANCVIVAHFYDVESGLLDLNARGQGHVQAGLEALIPRDGGIKDLLAEAERPDRRFVAVVCESVDRVARRTYFGVKVEHELEQAGVVLLAADEPMPALGRPLSGRSRKRATPLLTRRIKQAISEWYVLQLMELSWDGLCEHTEQGWNVGKPCYGYRADKIPHPVPARRAEGRTKTRLVPEATEASTVRRIFVLRAFRRLGYGAIADELNADLQAHPPPRPVNPLNAVGRWSGSAVREIVGNPKYTGFMVWNRRATKRGAKPNPPSEWIWSSQPTHEPLVTMELFRAAGWKGRATLRERGTPTETARSRHTYLLRSYIHCDICGRPMFGKSRRGTPYYACLPDLPGTALLPEGHPKSVWVREEWLLPAVYRMFEQQLLPLRLPATRQDLRVAGLPAKLQRALFDSFRLDVRFHQLNHSLVVRGTIPGPNEVVRNP
ncbi:hypothetical protein GCM10010468_76350 [Actinocorallia longicatena]|uniref:Resolvase/invertase-type recombinase catalytic domain-containing protein n=1 Tax=Actinocorallia longicatena TaxID=111803 RepID=A0ABP6QQF1_9ACTN